MTIADPVLQRFYTNLMQICNDPSQEPDHNVLVKIDRMLKYDDIVKDDSSILGQFAPIVLEIINSNQTTGVAKSFAISFLDMILPHYSYNEISTIFSVELMVKAFQGSDYLKTVLAKVLQRADASKISHTPLFYELFKTYAKRNCSVSTTDSMHKAIVALTLKSDEIRQKYLNDIDIVNILEEMKNDTLIQSRLIDLMCDILPVIPSLPTSLYLVSEEELAFSNDLLFYRYCVGTWRTLLHLIDEDDGLSFLKDKMKPQIDFCARKYVGEPTLLDDKEIYIDYDDFGIVYVLITASFVFPDYFKELNDKYKIISFSTETYPKYLKSNRFLIGVNTIFLRNDNSFFENFKLTHPNLEIFCHLLEDHWILEHQLTPEKYSKDVFNKISFEDLFEIFTTLSESNDKLSKMVNDWPYIITRVINTVIRNEIMFSSHTLETYLLSIVKSGVPLGNLENPIKEKMRQLEQHIDATVEEPVTETL